MIRQILAVALLVAASCSPVLGETAMKADAAYGVRYVQERVVELPADQLKPYLTLFGNRKDAKFAEVVKWFETDETLAGIKAQTHFKVMYTDDPIYAERYAKAIPGLPYVCLQAVDQEKPIAEYTGLQIPMTSEALARGLNTTATKAECFRRNRQAEPTPSGPNISVPDPNPQPLPPTPGKPVPHFPWLLFLAVVTLSAGAGVGYEYRKTYYKK